MQGNFKKSSKTTHAYNAYKRKISLLSVQPNNSIEERKDSIRFEDTFKREIFYSHSPRTNNATTSPMKQISSLPPIKLRD